MYTLINLSQALLINVVICMLRWCRAMPMKKKSEAHETLSLLFQQDGVPPTMITDGSREQTIGKFKKKCQ